MTPLLDGLRRNGSGCNGRPRPLERFPRAYRQQFRGLCDFGVTALATNTCRRQGRPMGHAALGKRSHGHSKLMLTSVRAPFDSHAYKAGHTKRCQMQPIRRHVLAIPGDEGVGINQVDGLGALLPQYTENRCPNTPHQLGRDTKCTHVKQGDTLLRRWRRSSDGRGEDTESKEYNCEDANSEM